MKLSDLKEIAMTHTEYDSITSKVVSALRSLFNLDELVSLAKESPYVEDKAKLDKAIRTTVDRMTLYLDPHAKQSVVQRIKKGLGV